MTSTLASYPNVNIPTFFSSDFDQHELNLYEEVAKMPPFDRKTLVLIGAQGVGRRSLISKLVLNEPDKFGNTMPRELFGNIFEIPFADL